VVIVDVIFVDDSRVIVDGSTPLALAPDVVAEFVIE
jgi:hypothetical protein